MEASTIFAPTRKLEREDSYYGGHSSLKANNFSIASELCDWYLSQSRVVKLTVWLCITVMLPVFISHLPLGMFVDNKQFVPPVGYYLIAGPSLILQNFLVARRILNWYTAATLFSVLRLGITAAAIIFSLNIFAPVIFWPWLGYSSMRCLEQFLGALFAAKLALLK